MMVARSQSSRQKIAAWSLVLLAAAYSVFSWAFRQTEFAHQDIVYNYGPFRAWFADQLRSGSFPLWDPFMGLGRFAEAWTSIPVDIMTLLEVPFDLSYRYLLVIQILCIFVFLRVVLAKLRLDPLTTTLTTLFFLLSPITAYFLRYYIKGWLFLLFGILFTFLYLYASERKRSHLVWIALCSLLLSLGSKFEYVLTLSLTIVLAYPVFVLISDKSQKFQTLWRGLAAYICPLLINFWSFNLVVNAAKSTLRLSRPPVVWGDFFKSMGFAFLDPHFLALVCLGLVLYFDHKKRTQSRNWMALAVIVPALFIFGTQQAPSGYAIGILLALAALLWQRRAADLQETAIVLVKAAVLLFYFTRPSPGDVDEMLIINWFSRLNQGIFGFLCMAGLGSKRSDGLARWSLVLIGVIFFYRSLGLVAMNYIAGILWLPARDNFLIELPLALFMAHGWTFLTGELFRPLKKWSYVLATVFIVLLLQNHPFLHKPLRTKFVDGQFSFEWKKEQSSDVWQKEMSEWRDGFNYEPFGQVRIMSYFHSYGRRFGIADVREYQSLLSGPFARYSIAGRLGIDPAEVKDVASTTAGLTPRFKRLVRPVQSLESIVSNPKLRGSFYMFYILTAAPKLDCDHLRLLGVRYLESDFGGYYNLNAGILNGLYSSMDGDFKEHVMADDVAKRIEACKFGSQQIGQRKFWVVGNPLPRAFFLPGVSAEHLAHLSLDDIKINGDKIRIKNGEPISWRAVAVRSYQPNQVQLVTDNRESGAVVLTDLFNSQWVGQVNGQDSNIWPAFSLVRAIDVNGPSSIDFRLGYPDKTKVLLCFLLGLIGLFLLFFSRNPVAK